MVKTAATILLIFLTYQCCGQSCLNDADCTSASACSGASLTTFDGTCLQGWCTNSTTVCENGCGSNECLIDSQSSSESNNSFLFGLVVCLSFCFFIFLVVICVTAPWRQEKFTIDSEIHMTPRTEDVPQFRWDTARLCSNFIDEKNKLSLQEEFSRYDTDKSSILEPEEIALYYAMTLKNVDPQDVQKLAYKTINAFGKDQPFTFESFMLLRHIQLLEDENYRKKLFDQLDQNSEGFVALKTFEDIFVWLDEEQLLTLKSMVRSTDGKMSFEEFSASLLGIASREAEYIV